ncbi:DHS-27 protein [Aphelenchoides avenae]|nr:DHS-27 protein [Aphelenchus avenae]
MSVKFEDVSLAKKALSDSGFTVGWTLQMLYERSKEFGGVLGRNAVKNITVKPLGEGQGFISVVYRVTVGFDAGDASLYSFVLKVPSTRHLDTFASETDNPEEARKGVLMTFAKAHNGECAFYDAFNSPGSLLYIPMPRVWYTRRFEDEAHLGAILMEDLSVKGTTPGIVNSVTLQQIKNVTLLLARFHAQLLAHDENTQGIEGSIVQIDDVFQALYQKGALALENEDPGKSACFEVQAESI